MKKTLQRLLIFFVGIPVLITLVVLLPGYNHLCLNLLTVLVSSLGAMEFQNILKQKKFFIPPPEAAILGGLIPALATAVVSLNFSKLGIAMIFMLGISWFFLSRILSSKEEQELFINRIAAGFSIIIYPGLFLSWLIPMALLPKP